MTSWDAIQRQVRERAAERCEYCRMHESLQGATFHIEHVVPRSHGGNSRPENLAWACPRCNLCKSDRVEVPDPESGKLVPLFNPRVDGWGDHFRWEDYRVVPLTAIGRATAAALDLNHPRRIRIRQAEETFDLFPPDDP
ncbi:MAG: HNH endonuclease [Pirellulales bacterium]|nr:HNH endonuclease [Pirellulales bacterium]